MARFDFPQSRRSLVFSVAAIVTLIASGCAPQTPATPPPAEKQPPPAATASAKSPAADTSKTVASPTQPAATKSARTDLVVATLFKITTLDPMIDSVPYSEIKLLMDPLISLSPEMKPEPGLVTEWKLVDPTTWELKLRQNVKFHNGDPFTAQDVKFNFDRILNPDTKSRQVPVYYSKVKDTVVVDDFTIRITSKEPWPGMLEAISFMRVAPAKYFQQVGAEAFAQKPVGTGPYKFVEWVKDSYVTLEANNDYWRGAPKIKRVTFRSVVEAPTRLAQLLTGEVDLIDKVPPPDADTVKNNPSLQLQTVRSMNQMFIGLNTFEKPFDDVRVRQAMNYAVNWDEIIQYVLNGYAYRNASSVGALTQGYDPNLKPYPYDPAKAKQLLAQAGYSDGFETTLDGPIGRYNADKEVAEAIVGQLARVGVRVKYNGSEFNAFFTRFLSDAQLPMDNGARGKASAIKGMYLLGCANTVGGDFDLCNRLYFHSKVRAIYFNTPRLDEMLDAVSSEANREARIQKAQETLKVIQQEAPWVFGYDDAALYGLKKGLTWTPRPDDFIDVYTASWQQ